MVRDEQAWWRILKWPTIVAAFSIELELLLYSFGLIGIYGFSAIALSVIFESPIIFYVAREAWRRAHLQINLYSEAWETVDERWSKTFTEYVDKIRRKTKPI